jgi:hypothetical protein
MAGESFPQKSTVCRIDRADVCHNFIINGRRSSLPPTSTANLCQTGVFLTCPSAIIPSFSKIETRCSLTFAIVIVYRDN